MNWLCLCLAAYMLPASFTAGLAYGTITSQAGDDEDDGFEPADWSVVAVTALTWPLLALWCVLEKQAERKQRKEESEQHGDT